MKPTFENTIDILVKAYLNDTLEHANCTACAVGNLVAHALNVEPVKQKVIGLGHPWRFSDGTPPAWQKVFCTDAFRQERHPENYVDDAKAQIDATGYTWEQLARIEKAFEKHSDRFDMSEQSPEYKDELMFKGLMAVVEVLADIHGVDLKTKNEAKALFVK